MRRSTKNTFVDLSLQQYKNMAVLDWVTVNDPNSNSSLISNVVSIVIVSVAEVLHLVYLKMMVLFLVHQSLHDVLNDSIHDELQHFNRLTTLS